MLVRSFRPFVAIGLTLLLSIGLSGCGGGDRGIDEEIDFGESAPVASPSELDEMATPVPSGEVEEEEDFGAFEVAPPLDSPAPGSETP